MPYSRTVDVFAVPRIGDSVSIDNIFAKVIGVTWQINHMPNGKSVEVFLQP